MAASLGSVPGARRRQPRTDGLEHAAPVGSVAARRGAVSSAPAWKASRPAIPAPWCWHAVAASSIRSTPSASSCASRASIIRGQLSREVGSDIYQLTKFKRSNQNTCINQKPIVKKGSALQRGRSSPTVLAPTWANWRWDVTCWWPSCRGAVTTSRTRSWSREKLVKEDYYTSIHIEEFEIEARDTKLGPEEITRDIPNVERVVAAQSRRERHHPHRRDGEAGRHPGGQGDAQGRNAAHSGREAAARHLRRKGRRRAGRFALLPAGHRRHGGGLQDLLPQGPGEGRARQVHRSAADRAAAAQPGRTKSAS